MTGATAAGARAARRLACAAMLGALLAACTGAVGPDGSRVPTAEAPSPSRSSPGAATGPSTASSGTTSLAPSSPAGEPSTDSSSAGGTTQQPVTSSAPLTPSTVRSSAVISSAVKTTAATSSAARTTAARTTAASTTATTQAPPPTSKPRAETWWRPPVGLTWQWQLSGTVDLTVDAAVYDLDLFETTAATVGRLHAMKRHVICYIDVGSWEDFRPDADAFPDSVKGASNGWPGERWLDIRQLDVLRPLMTKRLQQCADKGFDGVEPDLMDGFSNSTGFPLSAADQLRYNRMIAGVAHSLGLAVGLKGDPEQASALVASFDYAINESCVEFDECGLLRPFIAAGKPVFHVEYELSTGEFCPVTRPLKFSSMRKHLDLDAWREPC